MNINSSYTNSHVTFGYNKKLNQELKNKLSVYPDKQFANTLLSMNDLANSIEDSLALEAKASKISGEDDKYWDYLDMFLSIKQILTGFVSLKFEDLHYADREISLYYDEFKRNGSNKDDWHIEICNKISDFASTPINLKLKTGTLSLDDVPDELSSDSGLLSEQSIVHKIEPTSTSTKSSVGLSSKSILEEYKPTVHSPNGFNDVAGMEKLKQDLQDSIIQLIENPSQAELDMREYGKTIPRAILLYGPPGCGKTYITQALSSELKMPLYLLNISKAGSEYINMTSKNIKDAFDETIKIASQTEKPCLLFMDEIDSMAFDRTNGMQTDDLKQVATILQSIDLAKGKNVIIIGATNKYDILDPAVKRRFDYKVFVDVPDEQSRIALLKKNLAPLSKGQLLLTSEDELKSISELLNGFSNSSICNISKQAALNALKRNRADISIQDYKKAIEDTSEEKPSRKEYLPESKRSYNHIGFNR